MSEDQLTILTKHLDKKFDSVDTSFEKLFQYMQVEFKAISTQLNETNDRINGIQGTLDGFAKQLLDMNQEHLMLARKVDRLETWVQQVAQKAGVKLDY